MSTTRKIVTLALAAIALAAIGAAGIAYGTAPVPATVGTYSCYAPTGARYGQPVTAPCTVPATTAPATVPATTAPVPAAIAEDTDGWDCETMGNQVCGPVFVALGADGTGTVIDVHGRVIGTGTVELTRATTGAAHLPDTGDMAPCTGAVDFQRVIVAAGILPDGRDATVPSGAMLDYPIARDAAYATGAAIGSGGCVLGFAYAGDVAGD